MKWIFQVLFLLWHGWRPIRTAVGRWRWNHPAHAIQPRISAVLRQRGTWPGVLLAGPRRTRGAGERRCPSCRAKVQARRCESSLHVVGTVIWCPACKNPAIPHDWSPV